MKRIFLALLALLAAVGVSVPATANATPFTAEDGYLSQLYEKGIYNMYGNSAMLQNGYAICQRLRLGWSHHAVFNELHIWSPGLLNGNVGYVVGTAQGWLCPDTLAPEVQAEML